MRSGSSKSRSMLQQKNAVAEVAAASRMKNSYLMYVLQAIHPANVFSFSTLYAIAGCAMAAALGASLAVDIHFIC